jgi:hypothetical protein
MRDITGDASISSLEQHAEYFEYGWYEKSIIFSHGPHTSLGNRNSLLPNSKNSKAPSTHPATTVLLLLSARGGLTGFRPDTALFMNCAFLRRISA